MNFDMYEYLRNQLAWSLNTFGPNARLQGVVKHIRKELIEIEAAPTDLMEWIDVAILAFEGAWRSGHSITEIVDALQAKQQKNLRRSWPDWRTMSDDEPIEHERIVPGD